MVVCHLMDSETSASSELEEGLATLGSLETALNGIKLQGKGRLGGID